MEMVQFTVRRRYDLGLEVGVEAGAGVDWICSVGAEGMVGLASSVGA